MPTLLPSGQILRDYSGGDPAPRMTDAAKVRYLRSTLELLMSQIDYTMGACPMTARIDSLIKPDYMDVVRNILENTK